MNLLNAQIYELKGQLYRRNVPFELINHSNQAGDAKIGEDFSGEESDTFIGKFLKISFVSIRNCAKFLYYH